MFEVNENFIITEITDKYIIIDNFYKNYDELYEYIINKKKDIRPDSIFDERYNNYRTTIYKNIDNKLINIIKKYSKEIFKYDVEIINKELISINSISLNKNIESYLQHWPHNDPGPTAIIYLDKIGDNGTVIYKDQIDLSKDVFRPKLGYFRDTRDLTIDSYIESKPNRLVILNAIFTHGSYIKDHSKFIGNERIHQIVFTSIIN